MITAKSFTCDELSITNEKLTSIDSLRFYDVRTTPEFRIYGVMNSADGKCFVRMPEKIAENVSASVANLNYNPSGGRVRFVTTSSYVAIRKTKEVASKSSIASMIAETGFDIYIRKNDKEVFSGVIYPELRNIPDGYDGIVYLPEGEKEITLNFPIYSRVESLYIGLDCTSSLTRRTDYKYENPILYYGSSITQGAYASRPGMTYEAMISRMLDANYIALGFGGSAKGEDAIIEYLSTLDCSVFVLDYDHNAPTPEHLADTHEKLYMRFRETHPDTPVIMITKPNIYIPNYGRENDIKRREIIFDNYTRAKQRGENVIFIDGYSLFESDMRADCTVDLVHPNDLGMKCIADGVGKAVECALTM